MISPFPPSSWPFRLSLWVAARLLPMAVRGRSLEDLLTLATPNASDTNYHQMHPTRIVEAVRSTVRRPWFMRDRRCLREGVLSFRYLYLAGYRPVLHFGIVPKDMSAARPKAHCWVSVDGQIVLNAPDDQMVTILTYDGSVMPVRISADRG